MSRAPSCPAPRRSHLHEGWVIANHILVSFHVAFVSSVLALPSLAVHKAEVLAFIFVSPETIVSALFMYISFHTGIAWHEIGHFRSAARLNALNPRVLEELAPQLKGTPTARALLYLGLFLRAPYGKARGIKRESLNYYPDAPYNLAVAAAGPHASRNLALAALPPAVILLAIGLLLDAIAAVYLGRLLLGIGVVGLLDFLIADPGKYREFRQRERRAAEQAATVGDVGSWFDRASAVKQRMLAERIQEITHPRLGPVTAPWQFRNCGMGGRHTEKEYPESNVSMQEAMFLILSARDYQEGQEMTVRLQNRLKEIIEKSEGGRVMGIGLEGGLAPFIEKGDYPLPEVRLWAMMRQAIEECGYRPGQDVAIALDPAMSELEKAYREEFNMPDSVGMYLFWRDKAKAVMDRDGVLEIYRKAITEFEIPIASIEDGFSEDDREGWKMLLDALGDRVLVIGDDLVTTNDRTIEEDAARGLINTALIKANQIGSLYETLIAMLVALGKNLEIVVSHRSKSPNDDMEAHIALAVNALGLKAGGGANTERLVKYQSVAELMGKGGSAEESHALTSGRKAVFHSLTAYEEPTNAGIPTVGATAEISLSESGVTLRFRGATPLGTSAGTGEAIHLVDALVERAEHREPIERHPDLFVEAEKGVVRFRKEVRDADVHASGDDALEALFTRARRYGGKGCLNAVGNVLEIIAPAFVGRSAAAMTLRDVDRVLLQLEERVARRRGKLREDATLEERIQVMQRKQNLGMNAMLAVSLALARGIAHLKGQDLYEALRDEMIAMVARLCDKEQVDIRGSALSDYVTALREANRKLEARGTPLYEALREVSGIYGTEEGMEIPAETVRGDAELGMVEAAPREERPEPAPPPTEEPAATPAAVEARATETPPPVETPGVAAAAPGGSAELSEEDPAAAEPAPERVPEPAIAGAPDREPAVLTPQEREGLEDLDRALHRACVLEPTEANRAEALRRYALIKRPLASRYRAFGLVNNRIFRNGDALAVPYILGDDVLVHGVRDGSIEWLARRSVREGTILTDDLLTTIGGVRGEAIDLEPLMLGFHEEDARPVAVARIRDIAAGLKQISESANRTHSIFALRCLVARIVGLSFKAFLGAKNMQPEVRNLNVELDRFINSPLARRVPLLVRVLMRSIAGLATKPTVIDRLWNDTIDLAEVHVRGSSIVNELRRRTHHALGRGTLRLARAYLKYLETGDTAGLAEEGHPDPAAADEQARSRTTPRDLVGRIVGDLETFFEAGDINDRLSDWEREYALTLERCEFGNSLGEETEIIAKALRDRNRFVYNHHLRIVKAKADAFTDGPPEIEACSRAISELLDLDPGDPSLDVDEAEATLRGGVDRLAESARSAFQDELFARLANVREISRSGELVQSVDAIRELRHRVRAGLDPAGFPEQRRHLYHLDCLLEEMGYLMLRQLASSYEEKGVQLSQCLEIIRTCVRNLEPDGVPCQELRDLTDMLVDGSRTFAEVLNLLDGVQRCFHKMLQRVLSPFDAIRTRLGMESQELQFVTANLQRGLFDLNCMVHFAELATRFVREGVEDFDRRVNGQERPSGPGADAVYDILHISHRDEIRRRIESGKPEDCLRAQYGGKGSSLLQISHLNLPTRDGFILPTALPRAGVHRTDRAGLEKAVEKHLRILEEDVARRDGIPARFGDESRPLLLAVRGGSVISLPGILSTVVFTGMNDRIAQTLAAEDPWHAYDSYRRFLASFAGAVWGVDVEEYDLVEETKRRYGVLAKDDLPWEGMKEIAEATKAILRKRGHGQAMDALLEDPRRQLLAAIHAVFDSWEREAARRYREFKGICHDWHTTAIVQVMAFGNRKKIEVRPGMDETEASLTGVIPHTRLTDWGVRELEGEFKFSAAGDDLVSGVVGPGSFHAISELERLMPMLHRRIRHVVARLRRFHGTDQEMEFTVERGVLSILQSRTSEKSVDVETVAFMNPGPAVAQGIGVRGFAFRGVVAFDESDRIELADSGVTERDDVDGILMVMENPTPEDIPMILSADGLLTAKGGSTSHVAVAIHSSSGEVLHQIVKGDLVSLHGTSGQVYLGPRTVTRPDVVTAGSKTRSSPVSV
jgi:enolase